MAKTNTGTRRDDQIAVKQKLEIDPLAVLERLNIINFSIDRETKTVYLTEAGLKQVAAFFDFKLLAGVTGFYLYGWTYQEAVE